MDGVIRREPDIRVAVIGNSNSVMRGSYTAILAETPGLTMINRSIGGSPNVVLLDFLATETDWTYDFIIVETAVVDCLQSRHYTRERSKETLELFIAAVRARCRATIVILTVPTRYGLLAPERHWQELLYRETAARFGIPILDGFRLVRGMVGQTKMDLIELFVTQAAEFVTAFKLPDFFTDIIAWRSLRDRGLSANSLGISAFNDDAHVSFAIHRLVGRILGDFLLGDRSPRQQDLSLSSELGVIGARPIGGNAVTRVSSLISRDLIRISNDETARYHCPPGYRAFGLLINQTQTGCILQLRCATRSTALDLRYLPFPLPWIAMVVPILDDVGDSDFEVTLFHPSEAPEGVHRLISAQTPIDVPAAEIAELILVKRDWRSSMTLGADENAKAFHIEDMPFAVQKIAEAASEADPLIRGIETAGSTIEQASSAYIASMMAREMSAADRARVLLVMGLTDQLGKLLEVSCADQPVNEELLEMHRVTRAAKLAAEKPVGEFSAQGGALLRAGKYIEAEKVFAEGTARFTGDLSLLIGHAQAAFFRKDWPEANRRWRLIRERFPNEMVGYIGGATSLREAGRLDEAGSVLAAAADKFPDTIRVQIEQGWLEHRRENWDAAAACWAVIRERSPDSHEGYIGGVEAYRALGCLDDADRVASAAMHRFPNNLGISLAWADIAVRRRDWPEAARRWLSLKEQFPKQARCVIGAAQALAETGDYDAADAVLRKAMAEFPADRSLATRLAENATRRRQWAEAGARWESVRELFPDERRAYIHAMLAFVEAGDLVKAEELACLTVAALPNDVDGCVIAGDVAVRRRDFDAAVKRFAAAYAADPRKLHVTTRYVETLRRLDRRTEAAAVLDSALQRWPLDENLLRTRVEVALLDRMFDDAIELWERARQTMGDESTVVSQVASMMQKANPPEEYVLRLKNLLSVDAGG